MFHSSSSSYGDHPLFPLPSPAIVATSFGFFDAGNGRCSAASFPPLLSSSPPDYSSSRLPLSYLHRSSSSQSLPLHHQIPDIIVQPQPCYSSTSPPQPQQLPSPASVQASSACNFLDFNSGPVRRVFSTGDLQGMNGLQASGENYSQESGGPLAGRVGRYSAEERKERIERYRSKRHQRNFHKKITYACRKTLADSRPRVKGRFARNGETEGEMEVEMEAEGTATSSSDCYSYSYSYNNNMYDQQAQSCCSSGVYSSEIWSRMQAALATDVDDDECAYDDELLASFADVISMNFFP